MRLRIFPSFIGAVTFGVIGIIAYWRFGLVAAVIAGGVGLPASLALLYYWADLESRKGRGRRNTSFRL